MVIVPKGRYEMKNVMLLSASLLASITLSPTLRAEPQHSHEVNHKPVGGASITPAVVIRGFGPEGRAGVSSDLGGARHWSARVRGVPSTLDFDTTVTVSGQIAGGPVRTLSRMKIQEVRLPPSTRQTDTGDAVHEDRYALAFSPTFAASTYSVEIWNGSRRVLEVNNMTARGVVLAGNDLICDALGKANSVALGVCEYTIGTCSRLDDQGRFNWVIDRTTPVPWTVPSVSDEAVVGDQLRIIEETSPGPRAFTNVTIRGRNLTQMILLDEMANAMVPEDHRREP